MKKTLTAFLPALALLTLGSCASTSQLTSTEEDGVYYSSKDRTTQNATASAASYEQSGSQGQQGTDEATNPDYRSGSQSSSSSGSSASTEYYDDDYSYAARIRRFNQPVYRGFGYGYYDLVYTDPFWYGGYSPYAWGPGYYGAYYDPFYSPYAYGGTYVSINIGFGRPYYNPWRYSYGGYGYGGYGYGGYGYGGYYDGYRNGYYSGRSYGNTYGGSYGGVKTHYGPRRDGGREAVSSTAGQTGGSRGRGRIDDGGVANPSGGLNNGGNAVNGGNTGRVVVPGRGRIIENNNGGNITQDAPIRQPISSQSNTGVLTEQQLKEREARLGQSSSAAEQPRLDTNNSRGRWRVVENGSTSGTDASPATPQDYTRPRRSRYQDMQQPQQGGSGEQQPERASRQRIFSGDVQPGRSAEQPVRQQRSYSEPERSYSPPSNSGGGNSGGGGNHGGRGRMQ